MNRTRCLKTPLGRLHGRLPWIAAALMALAGCSRVSTPVSTGNRDGILHLGNKDEPAELDPHINTASSTSIILSSLFQGLVTFAGDGQTLLPGMAQSWEVSADGLTLTFHLRADGRWSNGEPLTAEDFRASFLRILDPQLASEQAGLAFPIRGARAFVEGRSRDAAMVGLTASDARTFVVQLEHPAPYFIKHLARNPFYPVYMPSLDANGGRALRGGRWTTPGLLVSNGPFTLAEWKPNVYLRVQRNPLFWDSERVRLREVRFYPTDDEAGEERSFRAGQLHATSRIPESKVPVYEAEHPEDLHVVPILRTNFLTFNVLRNPFMDARIRRAFALAVDRQKLVRAAVGKLGAPAFSFVRPGTGGYEPPKGFRYDPAEGARLLAEAGHPGGSGLDPVELTLNGNTGMVVEVAEVLQEMWLKNLGVRVTVRPLEFKVYLSTERERQFQVMMEGYGYIPDARDLLVGAVSGDPNNPTGSSDPAYDKAFLDTDRTPDESRRRADFDMMEGLNAREVFYAPIYYPNRGYLVAPSVRGWHDNALSIIDWRELSLHP